MDEPALWALVNWQIESGIDFLVACGSTGEAATLDEDEWLQRCVWYRRGGGAGSGLGRLHAQLDLTLVRQAALLKRRAGRGCGAFGQSLLQQAHAGGPVPAFSGAGAVRWIRCRCACTTSGAHGGEP